MRDIMDCCGLLFREAEANKNKSKRLTKTEAFDAIICCLQAGIADEAAYLSVKLPTASAEQIKNLACAVRFASRMDERLSFADKATLISEFLDCIL